VSIERPHYKFRLRGPRAGPYILDGGPRARRHGAGLRIRVDKGFTMVRKLGSTRAEARVKKADARDASPGSMLAAAVKESAQQIWDAGVGAFGKAQAERGSIFDKLLKQGIDLQKKTRNKAEERIGDAAGRVSAMADSVSAKAGHNWDKLEAIFERRTAKAMNKLGVPTAKDVEALSKRVDALASAVAKLAKRLPAAPKAPAAVADAAPAEVPTAEPAERAKPAPRARRRSRSGACPRA